jgi:tetratricopeptide (TPR) repeat protein
MNAANDSLGGVPSADPAGRLNSWKEIATYLGRTVRTIQRWERLAGLPIHRLQHVDGATVYAFRSELDRWWTARSRHAPPDSDKGVGTAATRRQSLVADSIRAATAPAAQPVGRDVELRQLHGAFDRATAGCGTLLTISGEAGIGKSTLVDAFLSTIESGREQVVVGRGRSSESLGGTEAFLPLVDALDDLLPADRTGALTRALKSCAPLWFGQLGATVAQRAATEPSGDTPPAAQPQRIKRELLAFFHEACRFSPIALFLDDIQWADSSSLDVLAYVTRQIESLRLLVVVTYRPDELLSRKHPFLSIKHDLEARGLCRSIDLQFLTRRDLGEYLDVRMPGLPAEFADAMFARTEGNPLFMASMLEYLQENGAFRPQDDGWRLTAPVADLLRDLPASVRGMIRRKIDSLDASEHRVLVAASVQGIEFHAAAVSRVLSADPAEVEEQLQRLEHVYGFVRQTAEQELPDGSLTVRYRFVHVLYQERLLSALTPARLNELSRATARTLEAAHVGHTAEIASRLATLYEAARDFSAATDYYLEAARRAVKVFAYEDAIELGYRGLATVARLPIGERRPRELMLLLMLASAIKAVRGFASNQLPELYGRARDLCIELDRTTELADVLWGLWGSQVIRLDLDGARLSVHQMQGLCERAKGSLICVQAAVGDSLVAYYRGDFAHTEKSWQLALSLYDPERHGPLPVAAGWDPLISIHGHAAWAALALGDSSRAVRELDASVERAREIGHVPILLYALFFAVILHEWRGDHARFEALLSEMHRLAVDYHLVHFLTISQFLHGRMLASRGDPAAGLSQMHDGLVAYQALGAATCRSRFVAMYSEELAAAGQVEKGLETVERELRALGSARYFEAELLRIRGELLRIRNLDGDRLEAERAFQRALEVARSQRATAFERRILLSAHGMAVPPE